MTKFEHIKYQIRARNHFYLCFTILLSSLSFFLFWSVFSGVDCESCGRPFSKPSGSGWFFPLPHSFPCFFIAFQPLI
jgi:hypothetical protein